MTRLETILMILLCITAGCKHPGTQRPDNDLSRQYINGRVKTLTQTTFAAAADSGSIVKGPRSDRWDWAGNYSTRYNPDGNAAETTAYKGDGSVFYRLVYEYRPDGKPAGTKSWNGDGTPSYRWVFTYDGKGRKTAEASFNAQGKRDYSSEFIISGSGKVTDRTFYRPDMTIAFRQHYTYDDAGNAVELNSTYQGGGFFNRYTFKYDSEGDKTEECSWLQSGKPNLLTIYSKGKKISEKSIAADGSTIYERSFSYEYDSRDNWVRMTVHRNGLPEYITEREFVYGE